MSRISSFGALVSYLESLGLVESDFNAELGRLISTKKIEVSERVLQEAKDRFGFELSTSSYGDTGSPTQRAPIRGPAQARIEGDKMKTPTMGMSTFAADRHRPHSGHSYFRGTDEELLSLVREHWEGREPGDGHETTNNVVLVPVPADRFMTTTVELREGQELRSELYRRRPHEDPFVRTLVHGPAEPAKFAKIVLYAGAFLDETGEKRSGPWAWEVVSINASPVEDEPMSPMTMARNQGEEVGGSKAKYSPEEYVRSILFWSRHAHVDDAE